MMQNKKKASVPDVAWRLLVFSFRATQISGYLHKLHLIYFVCIVTADLVRCFVLHSLFRLRVVFSAEYLCATL